MNPLSDGSYYLTYQDEDKLKDKSTKPVYLHSKKLIILVVSS